MSTLQLREVEAIIEAAHMAFFFVLELQAEQEKKRAQSLTDMLKNPTKVILLQVLMIYFKLHETIFILLN